MLRIKVNPTLAITEEEIGNRSKLGWREDRKERNSSGTEKLGHFISPIRLLPIVDGEITLGSAIPSPWGPERTQLFLLLIARHQPIQTHPFLKWYGNTSTYLQKGWLAEGTWGRKDLRGALGVGLPLEGNSRQVSFRDMAGCLSYEWVICNHSSL